MNTINKITIKVNAVKAMLAFSKANHTKAKEKAAVERVGAVNDLRVLERELRREGRLNDAQDDLLCKVLQTLTETAIA